MKSTKEFLGEIFSGGKMRTEHVVILLLVVLLIVALAPRRRRRFWGAR